MALKRRFDATGVAVALSLAAAAVSAAVLGLYPLDDTRPSVYLGPRRIHRLRVRDKSGDRRGGGGVLSLSAAVLGLYPLDDTRPSVYLGAPPYSSASGFG